MPLAIEGVKKSGWNSNVKFQTLIFLSVAFNGRTIRQINTTDYKYRSFTQMEKTAKTNQLTSQSTRTKPNKRTSTPKAEPREIYLYSWQTRLKRRKSVKFNCAYANGRTGKNVAETLMSEFRCKSVYKARLTDGKSASSMAYGEQPLLPKAC